ncbi:transmembrane protein [Cystoisospora suis]|uniref:Transmembrane protein n=1 Tax=Cystoisospora suis TaxID=483139 RepID=A0A2C6KPL4_9APIC|nr:transmembrane protein [Cystoisospora suis]
MTSRAKDEGRGGQRAPSAIGPIVRRIRSLLFGRNLLQAGDEDGRTHTYHHRGQVFPSLSSLLCFLRRQVYQSCFHLVQSCQQVAIAYGLLDSPPTFPHKAVHCSASLHRKSSGFLNEFSVPSTSITGARPPSQKSSSEQSTQQQLIEQGDTIHRNRSHVCSSSGVKTQCPPKGGLNDHGNYTDTAKDVDASSSSSYLPFKWTLIAGGVFVGFCLVSFLGIVLCFFSPFSFNNGKHAGTAAWLFFPVPFHVSRFRIRLFGGLILIMSLVVVGISFLCAYLVTATFFVPLLKGLSLHRRILRRWRRVAALLVLYHKYIREVLRWSQEMNVTYRAVTLDREEGGPLGKRSAPPLSSPASSSPVLPVPMKGTPSSLSFTQPLSLQDASSNSSNPSGISRERKKEGQKYCEDIKMLKKDRRPCGASSSSPIARHVRQSTGERRDPFSSGEDRQEEERKRCNEEEEEVERKDKGQEKEKHHEQGEEVGSACRKDSLNEDDTKGDDSRRREGMKVGIHDTVLKGDMERISLGREETDRRNSSCCSARLVSMTGRKGEGEKKDRRGEEDEEEKEKDDLHLRSVFLQMTLTAQVGLGKARRCLLLMTSSPSRFCSTSRGGEEEEDEKKKKKKRESSLSSSVLMATRTTAPWGGVAVSLNQVKADLLKERQRERSEKKRNEALQRTGVDGGRSSSMKSSSCMRISLGEMKETAHEYWITEREFCSAFQASLLHLLSELKSRFLIPRECLSSSSSSSFHHTKKSTCDALGWQYLHKKHTPVRYHPSFLHHQRIRPKTVDFRETQVASPLDELPALLDNEEEEEIFDNRKRISGRGALSKVVFKRILEEREAFQQRVINEEKMSRDAENGKSGESKTTTHRKPSSFSSRGAKCLHHPNHLPSLQEELLASGGGAADEKEGGNRARQHPSHSQRPSLKDVNGENKRRLTAVDTDAVDTQNVGEDGGAFFLVRKHGGDEGGSIDDDDNDNDDDMKATASHTTTTTPTTPTTLAGHESKKTSSFSCGSGGRDLKEKKNRSIQCTSQERGTVSLSHEPKEEEDTNEERETKSKRRWWDRFIFHRYRRCSLSPWYFCSQQGVADFFLKILRTVEEVLDFYELWKCSLRSLDDIDQALSIAQDHLEFTVPHLHRSLLADWGRLGSFSPGVGNRFLAHSSLIKASKTSSCPFMSSEDKQREEHVPQRHSLDMHDKNKGDQEKCSRPASDSQKSEEDQRGRTPTIDPFHMITTLLCCPLTPPKTSPLFRNTLNGEHSSDIRLGLGRLSQHVAAALTLLRLGPTTITPELMTSLSSLSENDHIKEKMRTKKTTSSNQTAESAIMSPLVFSGDDGKQKVTPPCLRLNKGETGRALCIWEKVGKRIKFLHPYITQTVEDPKKNYDKIEEVAMKLLPPYSSQDLAEDGGEKLDKDQNRQVQTGASNSCSTSSETGVCGSSSCRSSSSMRRAKEEERECGSKGRRKSELMMNGGGVKYEGPDVCSAEGVLSPCASSEILPCTDKMERQGVEEEGGEDEKEEKDSCRSRREDNGRVDRRNETAMGEKETGEQEKEKVTKESSFVSMDEWIDVLQDTMEHLGFAQQQCTALLRALRQKQQGGAGQLVRSQESARVGLGPVSSGHLSKDEREKHEQGGNEESRCHLALPAPPQTMLEVYKGLGEEGKSSRKEDLLLFDDQVDPATLAKGRLAVGELREVLRAHPRVHQQRQQKRLVKELKASPQETCQDNVRGVHASMILGEDSVGGRCKRSKTKIAGRNTPGMDDDDEKLILTVREEEGEDDEEEDGVISLPRLRAAQRATEALSEDAAGDGVQENSGRRLGQNRTDDAGGEDSHDPDRKGIDRIQLQDGDNTGVVVSGMGLGVCTPEQLRLERRTRQLADRAEARSLFSELDAQFRNLRSPPSLGRAKEGNADQERQDKPPAGGRVLWEGEDHQLPLDFVRTEHFLNTTPRIPFPSRVSPSPVMQRFGRQQGEREEELFCGIGEGGEEEEEDDEADDQDFTVPGRDEDFQRRRHLGKREVSIGDWGGGPWCVEGSSLDSDADHKSRMKDEVMAVSVEAKEKDDSLAPIKETTGDASHGGRDGESQRR